MEETHQILSRYAGRRLDQVLVELFPKFSRRCLQQWLQGGLICVDGRALPAKYKVRGGEQVVARFPETPTSLGTVQPEALALDIIYEDQQLIVINKPAGLVMHPAAGHASGTLQNGLLHYAPELSAVPRAGIVHRLDKETSGLLVVARTLAAHKSLVEQLQRRSLKRCYQAIVVGNMVSGGTVSAHIGRHPVDRKKMAVREVGGKEAATHYRVITRFKCHTHIYCDLETGRTHQIRVHMAHLGFPLLGDPVYGGRLRIPAGAPVSLSEVLHGFKRQALHATSLALWHPEKKAEMTWTAPLPTDMAALLNQLELMP